MPSMHRLGWVLFLLSSLGFLAAGFRDRDPVVIGASVLFAVACILFLLSRDGDA